MGGGSARGGRKGGREDKEGRRGDDKKHVLTVPRPIRLPTLADAKAALAAALKRFTISTTIVGGPADLAGYRLLAKPGGAGPASDLPLIHRLLTRYGRALCWVGGLMAAAVAAGGRHAGRAGRLPLPPFVARPTTTFLSHTHHPAPSLAANQVRCDAFYPPSRGTNPALEAAVLGPDAVLLNALMTADGNGHANNATVRRSCQGGR